LTRRTPNQDNCYLGLRERHKSQYNTTTTTKSTVLKKLIFLASLYTVSPEVLRPIASYLRIVGARIALNCFAQPPSVARLKTSAASAQQLQS
jgi:hypothetical protein